MKRFLLPLVLFCYTIAFSQNNRNRFWHFGEFAGVNFNTNPPTTSANSNMLVHEGCATMCRESNGSLLFYTDGRTVWKRTHHPMTNGNDLLGGFGSSTQSSVIIPKPGSSSIYYIFTIPEINLTDPMCYSIVDMTLDNGFGDVTIKNVPLYAPVAEKITATVKSNGVDFWIVAKQTSSDAFLAFSLTAAGVDPNPVISHAGVATNWINNGYARISRNGSRLSLVNSIERTVQLFDFNINTGQVSNFVDLTITPYEPYGTEFSPDNSKLYISRKSVTLPDTTFVIQYDLSTGSTAAILNSAIPIISIPVNNGSLYSGNIGALQLGPDDKIYVSHLGSPSLAAINQPNLAGLACDYTLQAIQLSSGSFCRYGLPNNIYYPPVVPCATSQYVSNNIDICADQTYQLPSGTIVNSSGAYQDTIRNNANTCDSIIYTINLSVYTVSFLNTDVHICPNQTYQLPSGTIVNAEGIYSDTLSNQASCDSIINTIHLFVDQVTMVNTETHICPGQSYTLPSGTIVSIEGIYLDTLRSQAFCDSIINTVHLFVDQVTMLNTEVHICPGQTFVLPSGTIVSIEGIYLDTLRSQAFCDSIINTIHLFVDQVSLLNTDVHICSNQNYQLPSGMIVNTEGVYIDTLRSHAFCDSIINIIHLTVDDLSYTSQVDSVYEGENYTLPSGVVVSSEGSYQSVLINSFGCDSVITTIIKFKKTIAACLTLKNAFTPNGDGKNDYWVLYRYNCFKKLGLKVYNRYGSLVYHADDYKNDWNGTYKNKPVPDGTYYYMIQLFSFDDRVYNFKGNVTILR